MLENFINFFKKMGKKDEELLPSSTSGDAAKERLHLVLMQDRANVSVDFLDLMKQEIIDVIKKYIDIDEQEMDVRFTNQINEDGTNGAPALYANIPIVSIKNEKKIELNQANKENKKSENITENSGNDKKEVTSKENVTKIEFKQEPKKENTEKKENAKSTNAAENKEKSSTKKNTEKTTKKENKNGETSNK